MKLVWLFLVVPAVLGQANFGTSYLKSSRLCRQWNCINTNLGLPDSLPARSVTEELLKRILPQGSWQDAVGDIVESCYGNRTRRYTNTCPGQALIHCIVDQMTDFCPEDSLKKTDACSPVSSLAGLKYMFSQSRYDNIEENLPKERRPVWFLKNYFDQKCCDLPMIFNSSLLQECGFTSFMTYYAHEPRIDERLSKTTPVPVTSTSNDDVVKVVDFNQIHTLNTDISNTDPLDCCDMKEFIDPSWRSDCGFDVRWKGHDRLVISNKKPIVTTESPLTTSTRRADLPKDLMLVPQSCEAETCVFRKLGIIDADGINALSFMKLLDNFTIAHPVWNKATARVVTKCLGRKAKDYNGWDGCEINKVIACTLDILTENCPYKRKIDDACRHHKQKTGCQISSTKTRPKNRREICLFPQFVSLDVLHECGLDSLYKAEHVVMPEVRPKKIGWAASAYLCEEQKPSTTCLMSKMGILNKYKFMDYFGLKTRIRQFMANETVWSAGQDLYLSSFINMPLYGQHCSSQKKLLNVIDAMLMTCPISKRVNSSQCTKIFKDMTDSTPITDPKISNSDFSQIMEHYHHIFLPNQPLPTKFDRVIRRKNRPRLYKKPIYSYGVLSSRGTPKVNVIAVRPVIAAIKPTVLPTSSLLPKYNLHLATPFHNDGLFRSNPFWLHDRIASGYFSTQAPNIPTTYPVPTNIPSTTVKIPPTLPTFYEPAWQMVKPE